jgi:electron transfer flavoprotein beta subunit
MGADRAVLVVLDDAQAAGLEPLAVAKLLAAVVARERPDLVVMGKQAIDDDANQTGQMLAALCGFPQATFASKLVVSGLEGQREAHVTREVDGGLQTLAVLLPAVVTADLRLNDPRYVTLPNIMKAKKKEIEQLQASELGVSVAPRVRMLRVADPPVRPAGVKVQSVAALVEKLRDEAKVI